LWLNVVAGVGFAVKVTCWKFGGSPHHLPVDGFYSWYNPWWHNERVSKVDSWVNFDIGFCDSFASFHKQTRHNFHHNFRNFWLNNAGA